MIVDSFRFLPNSFRAMYDRVTSDEPDVWAPFESRLADARIGLLTSAGLFVEGHQETFDLDRERREPTWGDPSWRDIPHDAPALGMAHLHVNSTDVLADRNVALPVDVLDDLVAAGVVGSAAPSHASVMGYQGDLGVWRDETGPAIVEHFRRSETNGVILAPV